MVHLRQVAHALPQRAMPQKMIEKGPHDCCCAAVYQIAIGAAAVAIGRFAGGRLALNTALGMSLPDAALSLLLLNFRGDL